MELRFSFYEYQKIKKNFQTDVTFYCSESIYLCKGLYKKILLKN